MKADDATARRRSTLRPSIYETPCSSFSFIGSHREALPPQLTRAILDGTLQTPGFLSRDSIRTSFRPDMSILTELDASQMVSQLDSSSPGDPPAEPPVRDAILKISDQTDYVSFSDILKPECYVGACKIGEGVYGEVFGITRGEEKTVVKIIPVEGDFCVNGADQKTVPRNNTRTSHQR
uniref:Protein kinase domain-containing protein n=1 Tax=Lygus hesperus TaxID=30085 RepID=A0A0K8TJY0_LYGHE